MKSKLKLTAIFLSVLLIISICSVNIISAATTATITYSFSGKNSADRGYAQGTITLTAPSGTYWLYWADDNQALDGYSEIAKLTVPTNATHTMPAQTAIPVEATKLIAIQSSSEPNNKNVSNAAAEYFIPAEKRLLETVATKKYSFGSYSDFHMEKSKSQYKNCEAHLKSAFDTAHSRGVDFIIGSGDYTNNDSNGSVQEDEWRMYQKILAQSDYSNPVYEAIGNHELWKNVTEGTKSFIKATGLEGSNNKSVDAYFEKTLGGDHFIFMSLEGGFYPDREEEFSDAQLDWLEDLLKKYSGDGKNIYIIEHSLFYGYGAGDRTDDTPYYDIPLSDGQASTRRFKKILKTYKDTIFISGHTHIAFKEQLNYSDNNDTSAQMIHNSSVGGNRTIVNGGLNRDYALGRTEGYIVDVYDSGIIFNGANLYYNEYDPNCCYLVRTSQQAYEKMTSTEPTEPEPEVSSYRLMGGFNNWKETNPFYMEPDSSIVTATIKLSAGTYEFKIKNGSTWYGNSGKIADTTTTNSNGGWEMSTSAGNCTLSATGGYYTFNFNTSNKKLIVLHSTTDPNATEPAETTSPTTAPITEPATTAEPTTAEPTTAEPTTAEPTTVEPTTAEITTEEPTTAEPTTAPIPQYISGDVDGSGGVSIKDATLIQKSLLNMVFLNDAQMLAADVNGDNQVNILDVSAIQKYVAGLIVSFTPNNDKALYSVGATANQVKSNLDKYYRFSSYDCYQALKKAYLNNADENTLTVLNNELLSVVDDSYI